MHDVICVNAHVEPFDEVAYVSREVKNLAEYSSKRAKLLVTTGGHARF